MLTAYGFIYITTNLINGKKYLGQKKYDSHYKNYLGSGKAFKKAVNKYGKQNFRREIVQICYSPEELNEAEYNWSVKFDVVNSDNWYNEVYGGKTMCGYTFSEESKQKISIAHIGRKPTDETRRKLSIAQKQRFSNQPGTMTGKTHSLETRKRISELNKRFTGDKNRRSKSIFKIEPNGNKTYFGSIREAQRLTGVNRSTIQYYIKYQRLDPLGNRWEVVYRG